jgi:hypothetical protein
LERKGATANAGEPMLFIRFAVVGAAKTATGTFITSGAMPATGLGRFDVRKSLGKRMLSGLR